MTLPGHRVRPLVLWGVAALLAAALVFVALRTGPLAPIRVTTQTVASGTLAPALFGVGTVEARRSVQIGPVAAGRVLRVAVDIGDRVKAGQLLAELDPVDLDERLVALDASVARGASAIAAAQAQLADAQARQQLAAINTRRYQDLGASQFVSAGVVEGKVQEQVSAESAVAAAQANLAAARQDSQRLIAERAGLRQQRGHLRLLAPQDGLVIGRDAEAGSTVVAGQAVLRLIDPASLWIKVRIDQGRSAGLAVGLAATIALRSMPSTALAGKVQRVEAVGDSVTEERIALVGFDPLPASVSVGDLAEVTLALPATAPALLLPDASVRRRASATGEQAGVWRVEADGLRFVPVRLGQASLDGQVQVLDGLRAGDRVVVYSEKELAATSRIQVVDALVPKHP